MLGLCPHSSIPSSIIFRLCPFVFFKLQPTPSYLFISGSKNLQISEGTQPAARDNRFSLYSVRPIEGGSAVSINYHKLWSTRSLAATCVLSVPCCGLFKIENLPTPTIIDMNSTSSHLDMQRKYAPPNKYAMGGMERRRKKNPLCLDSI